MLKPRTLAPIAAGLILAGVVLLIMPTMTAAGLIYAGTAAIVLSNLSVKAPLALVLFVLGAVLVDLLIADIGTSTVALPNISVPEVTINP